MTRPETIKAGIWATARQDLTLNIMREHQPPTLLVWGKNDEIFPAEGAHPYKQDLKNLEFHLLDTGHFALEEDGDVIANHMRRFLDKNVVSVQ